MEVHRRSDRRILRLPTSPRGWTTARKTKNRVQRSYAARPPVSRDLLRGGRGRLGAGRQDVVVIRAYVYLVVAIVLEVAGTLALRLSDGFRSPVWTLAVILGYSISIFIFARAMRLGLGLGVAYATLTGSGVIAAAAISAGVFGESLGVFEVAGLSCLVLGVVLLQPRRADEGVSA